MMSSWIIYLFCTFIAFSSSPCSGADSLIDGQSLLSYQTLDSKGGNFSLGFFSPGNSTNRYLGIWYTRIQVRTVVWVANRNNPVPNARSNSSRLELVGGLLRFSDGSGLIWTAYVSNATEAVLFDSGNFVLRNASGIIWQSFDYPTDTWLPGGTVGYNMNTELEERLVSWKNPSDPAPGVFSLGMDPKGGGAEIFMLRNRSQIWRSGGWQDGQFPSIPLPIDRFNFTHVSKDDTMYFMYNVLDESIISRIELGIEGVLRLWVWIDGSDQWVLYLASPRDFCDRYNICGSNAICDISKAPVCACLPGFIPNSVQAWESADFSGGCVRQNKIRCSGSDAAYMKVSSVRLPANPSSLAVGIDSICQFACSVNCSCNAYAYSSKGGCSLYTRDLLDLQRLMNSSVDLFVKMNVSNLVSTGKVNKPAPSLAVIVSLATGAALMILCCSCSCYLWRKRKRRGSKLEGSHQNLLLLELSTNGPSHKLRTATRTCHEGKGENKYELPIFSFSSIVAATNNFSALNKLGEGGFGPVYKGELLDKHFVAVKRLSRRSGQGLEEFRNETELFAKLQHRNLVGILGCCVEQDEKILVYEYMPNKSLDFFLFGQNKHELLDWRTRVRIIEGIAQGILYLHQYSRFRIVHRDLKASNILLDSDMNPKISDFGLARIFGGDKLQANTNRIVGTYGYMSPEYAMEGLFSIKSDVFAFGVLLLEIVSGKKNTGFYGSDSLSLLGHAWNLWINNRAVELVDSRLETPSPLSSAPLKYIHVGLVCVEESPGDRPTMVDVVAMLNGDPATFATPRHPAFTVGRSFVSSGSGSGEAKVNSISVNDMTVSCIEAR